MKNLAPLGGKPLLAWTAEAALSSRLDRVILSTDNSEIAEVGLRLGLEVPFIRPEDLATDGAASIDVVLHALDHLGAHGAEFGSAMLLQPTAPFRMPWDIDEAIERLSDTRADSVISVTPVDGHHPARMKFIEDGRLIDPPYAEIVENQPRQELRPVFIRNGAIYLTRTEILRGRSFKGRDSRAQIMPPERSVNIDGPFDLLIAEAVLRRTDPRTDESQGA